MAKVKIQGHASGTGVLTVTAPNTSTDRTITLPDATGTLLSTVKAGRIAFNSTSATGTTSSGSLGFAPKGVWIMSAIQASDDYSWIFYDGTDWHSLYRSGADTTGMLTLSNATTLLKLPDTSNQQLFDASGSSLDADTFTLSHTKLGSPTGTYYMMYIAIG